MGANNRITAADLEAATAAVANNYGNQTKAARVLGISRDTLRGRLDIASRPPKPEGLRPEGRLVTEIENGHVLIGSDAHYWPGPPSTGHRAFVKLIKKLKPSIVVLNGDALDFAGISRHPPIGWTKTPTPQEEIEAAQERLSEIVKASGKARRYWPCGNHDARMETFIAQHAPELRGVRGTSLNDHIGNWEPCWSLFINDRPGGVVVKHRFKGGMHAAHNNTLWAGRSVVTGHLHSMKVSPISDVNGTRFGVDGGCLADPYGPQFQGYCEDNPRSWRSGFVVLTFVDGRLLWPELCHVIEPGLVEFRGTIFEV